MKKLIAAILLVGAVAFTGSFQPPTKRGSFVLKMTTIDGKKKYASQQIARPVKCLEAQLYRITVTKGAITIHADKPDVMGLAAAPVNGQTLPSSGDIESGKFELTVIQTTDEDVVGTYEIVPHK